MTQIKESVVDGRFVKINTLLNITDATLVEGMNGYQGDNGRVVYFELSDGNFPHNLDGQEVSLEVKDAAGKIKVVNGVYEMISSVGGRFSIYLPKEVYQAAGEVEAAYLVVTDKNDLVVSSIPLTFTVYSKGTVISANASQDFIQSVKDAIADADKLIAELNGRIDPQRIAITTLQQSIDEATKLINSKQVAMQNSANVFNENNTFKEDVTVEGDLHAKASDAKHADMAEETMVAYSLDNRTIINNRSQAHTTSVKLLDGTLYLIRYGNTVTAKFNNAGSTILFNEFAGLIPAGSIPAGYRPIDFAALSLEQADWQTGRKAGNVWIYADGSIMSRSTYNKNSTDSSVISIYGTYQTADDMPK